MQIAEHLTHAESLKLYYLNFVARSLKEFLKLARWGKHNPDSGRLEWGREDYPQDTGMLEGQVQILTGTWGPCSATQAHFTSYQQPDLWAVPWLRAGSGEVEPGTSPFCSDTQESTQEPWGLYSGRNVVPGSEWNGWGASPAEMGPGQLLMIHTTVPPASVMFCPEMPPGVLAWPQFPSTPCLGWRAAGVTEWRAGRRLGRARVAGLWRWHEPGCKRPTHFPLSHQTSFTKNIQGKILRLSREWQQED